MLRTIRAKLVVSVNDRFGVAVGVESVAEFLQLRSQLEIVVNLAVENDPGVSIPIVDRLLPMSEIDNRQPAHRQSNPVAEIKSIVIRAAMTNGVIHARK